MSGEGPTVAEAFVGSYSMDEREAFEMMSKFLWQYANRAGDQLFNLLGDIHLEADGVPTDPTAWDDWLACIREVKAGNSTEG